MYIIVVWKNLNNGTYYYKKVKGTYRKYYEGYINHYNHRIILIIKDIDFYIPKVPKKKMVLKKLISFLQKLEK